MRFSFDIIGDIAIVEMQEGMNEKEVVREIRKRHQRIKTILAKVGERTGKYRIRKFKKLFGNDTETVHKEYGMQFVLDVEKAYFSPRESTERQRIASKVKPNESVLVMFAGIGPYGIAIAKKQPEVKKVVCVEINPHAVKYMKDNIRINKVGDKVVPLKGDVKDVCRDLKNKFDRVIMPLPLESEKYLEDAILCINKKGTIYFYSVGEGKDIFKETVKKAKNICREMGVGCRIAGKRKVLSYGPRRYKICIDLIVYKGDKNEENI